jgi:hypothetical protein
MCSFPGCRVDLARERNALAGQLAHIVGKSQNGPRGTVEIAAEVRDAPENLMLLCYPHHREIDDRANEWPESRLRRIKQEHEAWVKARLDDGSPWRRQITQLEYINVPRILMLSELRGDPTDIRSYGMIDSLKDVTPLISVMREFNQAIDKIDLHAVELSSLHHFDQHAVGKLIAFSENFRTKNCGRYGDDPTSAAVGDLKQGPQIYLKTADWRLVMLIDPRWITTVTAHVDFESGQHRFAGIAMIKSVDDSKKIAVATPYFLGI